MMEYQLQVTLKKIEILNPNIKSSKVIASLTQGDCIKRIANPRFIRNKLGSFYLERLVVSTSEISESNQTALLQVWSILNSGEQEEIGSVQFDMLQLVKEAEKTSSKAESHRLELPFIILEFDTLVSVRKDKESYFDESQEDFATSPQEPNKIDNRFIGSPQVKSERVAKELIMLEHKLYDASPNEKYNSEHRDIKSNATPEPQDTDSELSGRVRNVSEKVKIVRKDSNTKKPNPRTNIFVSKKKSQDSENESSQKKLSQTSPNLLAVPKTANTDEFEQIQELPPAPFQIHSEEVLFTPSSPHGRTMGKQQDTSIDKQPETALGKSSELVSSETVDATQSTANSKPYIPPLPLSQGSIFDKLKKIQEQKKDKLDSPPTGTQGWRKVLPQIEVPEYSPQSKGPTAGKSGAAHKEGTTPPPLIRLVSAPVDPNTSGGQTSRLSMRPRKSSFRKDKDKSPDQSLLKKEVHVHYTPEVAIRELDDKINRLKDDFSKRDVKRNIIMGLLALAVGYFLGGM